MLGGEDTRLPNSPASVTAAYLVYEKQEVQLRLYPADTLQQARIFYDRLNAIDRVLALEYHGWRVSPNFHFGFMATGLVWTTTTISSAEYMHYWQLHIGKTVQVERRDWPVYWDRLVKENIAQPVDRESFDRAFTNTIGRHSANPRPGIKCVFTWKLSEAERLDARDQLTVAVRERINELLTALAEALLQ